MCILKDETIIFCTGERNKKNIFFSVSKIGHGNWQFHFENISSSYIHAMFRLTHSTIFFLRLSFIEKIVDKFSWQHSIHCSSVIFSAFARKTTYIYKAFENGRCCQCLFLLFLFFFFFLLPFFIICVRMHVVCTLYYVSVSVWDIKP